MAQPRHKARPQGIQVNVANEFEEVRLLLDQDRLVPVLHEVTNTAVAPIEPHGVSGQQSPHGGRQGTPRAHPCPHAPGPDQQMKVIRQKGPGQDLQASALRDRGEARHEIGPIAVIAKEGAPLESAHHHVMEHAGRIQPWSSWHGAEPTRASRGCQGKYNKYV